MSERANFTKGIEFVKKNPQLFYTIFMLIVIPLTFLFSAQKFLNLTQSFQERLEKDRIGLMQDVFVEFARETSNLTSLQNKITSIARLDGTISEFRILEKRGYEFIIVASLNKTEVGNMVEDLNSLIQYRQATTNDTFMFKTELYGARHWGAVRGILDDSGNVKGVVYTNISAEHIDGLLSQKRFEATYFLVFIIIIIIILLIRQAKIIDYTVLYRRLKEVDQMKDDFVSMVAHELRTPLTIISGYAEMLYESDKLSKNNKGLADNIVVSTSHLNMLISDILDVSRIQQGRLKFEFEKVDISNTVKEVTDSLTITAKEKGLALFYKKIESKPVKVDKNRLSQVLINLIGNSIKYTKKGKVVVTIDVVNNMVSIRISDTGIGISAEDQEKLFSRFYRVKSKETEDVRGTGLGLWISREITEQMNGKITVESIKGKGTDFVLTFPIEK